MQKIAVILEPADEGGLIARVPALPGCVTEGDTRNEALAMARDAVIGYLASMKKHGETWPPVLPDPIAFVEIDDAAL
ncbi:MAG: type II toxin-antitoxin system HicB family antitoxin [Sulfobacillus sp.]